MSQRSVRVVILLTTLITAIVHGVILNLEIIAEEGRPDVLFSLNALGFLALLAAFWFRPAFLINRSAQLDYAFIGFTGVTIVAWIAFGARTLTGFATKLDELILIYALFAHLRAVRAGSGSQCRAPGS